MKKLILLSAVLSIGIASTSHASVLSNIIRDTTDNFKGTVRFIINPVKQSEKILQSRIDAQKRAMDAALAAVKAKKIAVGVKGNMTLHGGTMEGISVSDPSVIIVSLFNTSWNVRAVPSTSVVGADNKRINLSDIRVGDLVNFSGTLSSEGPNFVTATGVKDFLVSSQ